MNWMRSIKNFICCFLCIGWLYLDAAATMQLCEWRFFNGDCADADAEEFNDEDWRHVKIPHDWSIEGVPEEQNPSAGGNGFFPMGVGWYRTQFETPELSDGAKVDVVFEGVYRNATVWINGHLLGTHAHGYTEFRYDLSPFLVDSGNNILAVRVDNSAQPNSRYYSGSGIYRPVHLEVLEAIHLEPYSLFAHTKQLSTAEQSAIIHVQGVIRNHSDAVVEVVPTVSFHRDMNEGAVEVFSAESISIEVGDEQEFGIDCELKSVRLWSPDSPFLYDLKVILKAPDGSIFGNPNLMKTGVRTIRISTERGFELNGENIHLFGGNVHHDHGVLGAAAFPEAERRKVMLLKRAGFNAVRTSHNPPSTAFLQECDRQGLLVIDESFDMWKASKVAEDYSRDWDANWQEDVRSMVLRDRNHASVVMWSVGNEVYERTSSDGTRRGHALAAEIRTVDSTRPVTIGLNGAGANGEWSDLDGVFAAFDAAGYNYELTRYEDDHERLPNRVIYSSESFLVDAFESWDITQKADWVIGDFVWSAIDYLGEAGIGKVFNPGEKMVPHWEGSHFPWHGAYCGDIDLTGWRKPVSHYRQIVWDAGEKLYAAVEYPTLDGGEWVLSQWASKPMLAAWDWDDAFEGSVKLEVYSRYERIEVMLNGEVVSEKKVDYSDEFKARIELPYEPGELKVIGYEGNAVGEVIEFKTPGEATQVTWVNQGEAWASDELVFVELRLEDADGNPVARKDRLLDISVSGEGELIGFGSGDVSEAVGYQVQQRMTCEGRALVVVKRNQAGSVTTLEVKSEGLKPCILKL